MVFLLIALLLAYLFSYLTNLKMVVVDRLRVYPKKYDYSSDLVILEMIYSSGNHYATGWRFCTVNHFCGNLTHTRLAVASNDQSD